MNTISRILGCTDGGSGSYHGDESNDQITISSVNGGPLTAGQLARVEATVWAWSTGSSGK